MAAGHAGPATSVRLNGFPSRCVRCPGAAQAVQLQEEMPQRGSLSKPTAAGGAGGMAAMSTASVLSRGTELTAGRSPEPLGSPREEG